MLDFFKKLFGSKHEKDVKRLTPVVDEITALLPALAELSDEQLRGKTDEFRARIQEGGVARGRDGVSRAPVLVR